MVVILGRDRGDLPLRGAEGLHVEASQVCVHVHEDAALSGVLQGLGGQGHVLGQFDDGVEVGVPAADVPGAIEHAEHACAIFDVHLFGADGQHDFRHARLDVAVGLMQGRAGRRAGILYIDDGNAGIARGAQRDFTGHHELALQRGLAGIAEKCRTDGVARDAGVSQRRVGRRSGEVLDRHVRELPERRHADTDDVYVIHAELQIEGDRVGQMVTTAVSGRVATARGPPPPRAPKVRPSQTISARPLFSTTTSRSTTRARKEMTLPWRHISVRIVSPGKTGDEKRACIAVSRLPW